ncbi:MAG: hypothetical protein FWD92_03475 [Methanomassiliicoccaceae archaeon]|nr:hypothetical protein [Methanomassiliicoccaceae archaeon]
MNTINASYNDRKLIVDSDDAGTQADNLTTEVIFDIPDHLEGFTLRVHFDVSVRQSNGLTGRPSYIVSEKRFQIPNEVVAAVTASGHLPMQISFIDADERLVEASDWVKLRVVHSFAGSGTTFTPEELRWLDILWKKAILDVRWYDDAQTAMEFSYSDGSAEIFEFSQLRELLELAAYDVGAIINRIENIRVNGTDLPVIDKTVNIDMGWDNVIDKPQSFRPSIHTHTISDVRDLSALLNAAVSEIKARSDDSTVHIDTRTNGGTSGVIPLPVVNSNEAGVANPSLFNAVAQNSEDIACLRNMRFVVWDPSNRLRDNMPTSSVMAIWTSLKSNSEPNIGVRLENSDGSFAYRFEDLGTSNPQWRQQVTAAGLAPFTNARAGSIRGSTAFGQVFAEPNGTGSVNGMDQVNASITNHALNTNVHVSPDMRNRINDIRLFAAEGTSTSAQTAATLATGITGITIAAGVRIRVTFHNGVSRTAATTLTVNGASSAIQINGANISASNPLTIPAGGARVFERNGATGAWNMTERPLPMGMNSQGHLIAGEGTDFIRLGNGVTAGLSNNNFRNDDASRLAGLRMFAAEGTATSAANAPYIVSGITSFVQTHGSLIRVRFPNGISRSTPITMGVNESGSFVHINNEPISATNPLVIPAGESRVFERVGGVIGTWNMTERIQPLWTNAQGDVILGENRAVLYAAEGTSSSTATPLATGIAGITVAAGARIRVRFTAAVNRTAGTTLTVNGASSTIQINGAAISATNPLVIPAGESRVFERVGTVWNMVSSLPLWTNIEGEPSAVADTKLDRVTSGNRKRTYIVNASNNQEMQDIATAATAGTIVERIANGQITVPPAPANNTDAVSKQYVDSGSVVSHVAEGTVSQNAASMATGIIGITTTAGTRIRVRFTTAINRTEATRFVVGNTSFAIWINGAAISASNPLTIPAGESRIFELSSSSSWNMITIGIPVHVGAQGNAGLVGIEAVFREGPTTGASIIRNHLGNQLGTNFTKTVTIERYADGKMIVWGNVRWTIDQGRQPRFRIVLPTGFTFINLDYTLNVTASGEGAAIIGTGVLKGTGQFEGLAYGFNPGDRGDDLSFHAVGRWRA